MFRYLNLLRSNVWDNVAENLDDSNLSHNYSYDYVILPALKPFLKNLYSKKVLDIGCGTCEFCNTLFELGAEVTGIDYSAKMIEKGKQKYPRLNLFQHDIAKKTPFNKEFFDEVFCLMLFQALEDKTLINCIAEIYRVLKPGGRAVFVMPHSCFISHFRRLKEIDSNLYKTSQTGLFHWKLSPQENVDNDSVVTPFNVRSLSFYLNLLLSNKFILKSFIEPVVIEEGKKLNPADHKLRKEVPLFLIIECIKN